jgi:hypothetical protein
MLTKFLQLVKQYQYDIFLGAAFALVIIISFNLGKTGVLSSNSIKIGSGANIYKAASYSPPSSALSKTAAQTDLRVVASKNSTSKLYHFTWCSGAKRIKEENKIWFASAQEAISSGYSLANNCQ